MDEKEVKCYACGKSSADHPLFLFTRLREDGDVYLCEDCSADIYDKVQEEKHRSELDDDDLLDLSEDDDPFEDDDEEEESKIPVPDEIKRHLDQYVIGQEETKKILSVAAYNHYKTLLHEKISDKDKNVELQKSNVVMVGPTGSGKTEVIRALSRIMNVPLAIADCSSLSKTGY